ncbi:hypothetical protein PLUTE_a4095 [Pseudoalteromonas luteoviolacea DSM 6061]|nr:hypothetical protein [Pseudoalteromonas luteoviolacea DSM 6061]
MNLKNGHSLSNFSASIIFFVQSHWHWKSQSNERKQQPSCKSENIKGFLIYW